MSNVAFLWIFSRGIELGVLVLCLLPIRVLLRKKAPSIYSYLLWAVLPANVILNMGLRFLAKRKHWVIDRIYKSPQVVVDETIIKVMRSVWSYGTLLVIFAMIYSYLRFRKRLVGSIRVREGIYLAERIGAPFTLGIFRPKIYLPSSLPEEYQEAVILHERVHVARKDVWLKCFAIAFCGLFWFQPMLVLAYRRFVNDMERACDEAVLRQKGSEYCKEYARILVEVSYLAGKVRGAAIGYGNGEIKERVENVMRYECQKCPARKTVLVGGLLLVTTSILLSWQVPRIVRAEEQKRTVMDEISVEKTGIVRRKVTDD